jgi:hypothetical protein
VSIKKTLWAVGDHITWKATSKDDHLASNLEGLKKKYGPGPFRVAEVFRGGGGFDLAHNDSQTVLLKNAKGKVLEGQVSSDWFVGAK